MKIYVRFFLILFVAIFVAFFSLRANAQSASLQLVVTWQAYGSYVPPQYIGKALPSLHSEIAASVALLSNGKLVDVSNQTVYWYLNDTLVEGGVGKQYVVLSPFGAPPAFLDLRAELPSYNGTTLIHDVQIPFVDPKAVIEAPHPGGQFSGSSISIQGTPYFFYTSDPGTLSYGWSVNGQTSASVENPQTLQIKTPLATPSGSLFGVSLTITDRNNNISENDSTNITYVKQL